MARMLGRFETPGCCPGTRWRKRVEQREFLRSLLPEGELDVATDVWSDCVHGCDGECVLQGGSSECGLTCHPGRVWPEHADALLADEEMRGHVTALWPED